MTYSLEVVSHLKLVHLVSHVSLHFRVGVIDDGQEHVDQDEEDKEDKQHEEDGSQVPVGGLQLVEVKVSQDDTEQCEARERMDKLLYIYSAGMKNFSKKKSKIITVLQGVAEIAEILDLGSKQQISKLGESQEDDEEHDCKSEQILSTTTKGGGELGHGLVETDVFENLLKETLV